MPSNLKDRLRYIQSVTKNAAGQRAEKPARAAQPARKNNAALDGWMSAGFQTIKREIESPEPFAMPPVFPRALPVLVPDFTRCITRRENAGEVKEANPASLLFFDLETTGLSGGAGTVAFLAAFGRLIPAAQGGAFKLRVTQYLLLDYPGEGDFLAAALGEFSGQPLVVSYNGKSFDSQILKTRCLMNGIHPPEYFHADLLHPARRLWKNVLENCSQSTVEENILGIDRAGDISGAQAPEIWFDFLRNGGTENLLSICDHNLRDINGLAAIFTAMAHIARDPLTAAKKYFYDAELLALRWREVTRRAFTGGYELYTKDEKRALQKTGEELLCFAAKKGGGKAAFFYALDLLRSTQRKEGREKMLNIVSGAFPAEIKARALRALAIDSERRLADIEAALALTDKALELPLADTRRSEFERRRERMLRKIDSNWCGRM